MMLISFLPLEEHRKELAGIYDHAKTREVKLGSNKRRRAR